MRELLHQRIVDPLEVPERDGDLDASGRLARRPERRPIPLLPHTAA